MKGWSIKELEHLKSLSLKIQETTSSVAITVKLVTLRNKKHGWIPVKYVNVLHLRHFLLNKLQKYYSVPLGTLAMSGCFHKTRQCQLVEILLFICMQKMNSTPNFFFCDIVKMMQRFHFE